MPFNSFSTQDAKGALAVYEKYKCVSEEYKPLALSHKVTAIALRLLLGTKQAASEVQSSPARL